MHEGATPLSLTLTYQLTIHQHFHMVEEHSRALDLDRSTIRLMLSLGSNSSNNIGTIEENIRVK